MDDYGKFRRVQMQREKDYEEKEWRRLNVKRQQGNSLGDFFPWMLILLVAALACFTIWYLVAHA